MPGAPVGFAACACQPAFAARFGADSVREKRVRDAVFRTRFLFGLPHLPAAFRGIAYRLGGRGSANRHPWYPREDFSLSAAGLKEKASMIHRGRFGFASNPRLGMGLAGEILQLFGGRGARDGAETTSADGNEKITALGLKWVSR